jgi:hypothetical protein
MPSAVYFRRRADIHWSLAQIDSEPAESRRHRARALDCMTKARELDLDELQSRVMPIRDEWRPAGNSEKRTKAAPVGGPRRATATGQGADHHAGGLGLVGVSVPHPMPARG